MKQIFTFHLKVVMSKVLKKKKIGENQRSHKLKIFNLTDCSGAVVQVKLK
jgi:hypothetical protein